MNSTLFDQYYTCPVIANKCLTVVKTMYDINSYDVILEPSAGAGAFFELLPSHARVGIDIDPHCASVGQQDFFDYVFEPGKTYLVVGNPPFGRNANLAVKFFNHSAKHQASAIAFILPRTFRKSSIINRLDPYYYCRHDEVLPPYSFVFDDKKCDVPCVFQIWQRMETKRCSQEVYRSHPDFVFCTKAEADVAIQRVGVRAGIMRDRSQLQDYSHESHFLMKLNDPGALDILATLDFDSVKFNTAGNPSISRSELIELYAEKKRSLSLLQAV